MIRVRTYVALVFSLLVAISCSTDYKNLDNPTAQRAILELAENYLTGGNCDAALEVLQPLLVYPYVNYDSRILEASAYGCRGGINFPNLIVALKEAAGSDIWSAVVKSNHSASGSDGKTGSLKTAVNRLQLTTGSSGSEAAVNRSKDANAYMIFVSVNIIGTVISPLGAASSVTGKRTQALNCAANCTDADRCNVQVAFANISDSLDYVSTGTAIDKVSSAIDETCAAALGGVCPTNKNYDTCMGSAALRNQGELLVNAIETSWSI